MRVVFAILSACFVLTGTWFYQQTLAENQMPAGPELAPLVIESYRLRITPTFAAGVDPFAEDVASATSLKVSHQGETLLTVNKPIAAGQLTEADLKIELRPGRNDLLVEMNPADPSSGVPRAVRVELLRGDNPQPIQAETIWAPANEGLVVGTVAFDVPTPTSDRH